MIVARGDPRGDPRGGTGEGHHDRCAPVGRVALSELSLCSGAPAEDSAADAFEAARMRTTGRECVEDETARDPGRSFVIGRIGRAQRRRRSFPSRGPPRSPARKHAPAPRKPRPATVAPARFQAGSPSPEDPRRRARARAGQAPYRRRRTRAWRRSAAEAPSSDARFEAKRAPTAGAPERSHRSTGEHVTHRADAARRRPSLVTELRKETARFFWSAFGEGEGRARPM